MNEDEWVVVKGVGDLSLDDTTTTPQEEKSRTFCPEHLRWMYTEWCRACPQIRWNQRAPLEALFGTYGGTAPFENLYYLARGDVPDELKKSYPRHIPDLAAWYIQWQAQRKNDQCPAPPVKRKPLPKPFVIQPKSPLPFKRRHVPMTYAQYTEKYWENYG